MGIIVSNVSYVFLKTYVQAKASLAHIRQITCVACQLVDSPFIVRWSLGGLIKLAMVLRHSYAILMFVLPHHPAEPHRNTNIHQTRYVITYMHDIRIYSGNIIKNTLHTRKFKNHRTLQQPIFTETRLLKQSHMSPLATKQGC